MRARSVTVSLIAALAAFCLYFGTLPEPPARFVDAGGRETREITLFSPEFHVVSFGAYESYDIAVCESARFALRGASGATYYMEGKYFAPGASFADLADARSVCESLRRGENIRAEVLTFGGARLTVRATASAARLDALEIAAEAYRDHLLSVEALAAHLDSGGDIGSVRALAEVELTRLDRARERLAVSTADADNEFCRELTALMTDSCDRLAAALGAPGFSSALRICAVSGRLAFYDFIENAR